MKAKLSIAAGFLVGAALLYFAFRNINFGEVLALCRNADPVFIVPFFLTMVAELFFRGYKWKLLLAPAGPVRIWDAFRLEAAGLALNNILPLRLGEVVRGTSGAKLFNIPVMAVFATILVERALDVIILFILLAAVALGGTTGGFLDYGAYLWGMLGGLAAAIGVLIFIDEIMAHRFFSGFFGRFPRLKRVLGHLGLGVSALHSLRTAVPIFVFATIQWILNAANYYWVARAFGIESVIGAVKSVVLVFTGAVACSVPGMPGFFGNFEATISRVVSAWGVPAGTSLAYATYLHVLGYLMMTTLGLVFAYQMGHSLGRVWAQFGGERTGGG